MIQITIEYVYKGRHTKHPSQMISPCVPRKGEKLAVQYWDCPIIDVYWHQWSENGQMVVRPTIYVDVSETNLEWATI